MQPKIIDPAKISDKYKGKIIAPVAKQIRQPGWKKVKGVADEPKVC